MSRLTGVCEAHSRGKVILTKLFKRDGEDVVLDLNSGMVAEVEKRRLNLLVLPVEPVAFVDGVGVVFGD